MLQYPKPKVVTIPTPSLQVVGRKIDEAFSTKHLSKSPSTPDPNILNYTFQRTEPVEKHVTSGGFKIPQGNFGKGNRSSLSQSKQKEEEIIDKKKLSKREMLEELGFCEPEKQENEFLNAEPFTDMQMLETLKNKRDVADLVINDIEKKRQKIQLQRENLKNREKSLKSNNKSQSLKNQENIIIYDDYDRSQIVSHNLSTIEAPTLQNVEALLTAHQQKMRDLQYKYLENKIHKIDRYESSVNKEREPSSQSKSRSESENHPNMLTMKIRHVPLPKQKKKNIKKNENFSFMPPQQITPKNYEKEFRKYLENKWDQKKEFGKENENENQKNLIFRSNNQPHKKRNVDLNTLSKDELELMQFFFEDIPQLEPDVISKNDLIEYLKKNDKILDLYDLNPLELKNELNQFYTESPLAITFQEFVTFLKTPRLKTIKTESSTQEEQNPATKLNISNVRFLTEKDFALMEKIYNDLDRHQDFIVPLKELVKSLKNDVQIGRILQEPLVYLAKIEKSISLERALYQLEREGGDKDDRKEKEYISLNYFKDFLQNYRLKPYLGRENYDRSEIQEEDSINIDKGILETIKSCYTKIPKIEGFCKVYDLINEIRKIKRFQFLADTIVRTKVPSSSIRSESLRDILKRIEIESDEYVDFDEFLEFFTCRGRPKSMIILDSKERKHQFQEKLRNFLQKKTFSPKKPVSPGKKTIGKSSKSPTKNNLRSSKLRINSEESPLKKHFHGDSSLKLRLASESSEHNENAYPDDVITKRGINSKTPAFDRSVSWDDVIKKGKNKEKNQTFQIEQRHKARNPMFKEKPIRVIDGYDSDPEYNLDTEHPKTIKNFMNLSFSETKKKEQNSLKITVPMPFEFDERDKLRKMHEVPKEKKKYNEKSMLFKANPVPEFVKDRNLLEKINKEQEARREEIKKNSRIITMQREKPFSLYGRDLKKQNIRKKNHFERKEFQFKANPVPWFCSIKLFDIINEEERAKREERISKNAQISLNMSKLPPRMEKHEQEKKAHELKYGPQYKQINYDEDCTFKPKSPKKVPNFKGLQKTFQNLLDNKRRNYRPTKAISPKFHESKKIIKRENFEEEEAKRNMSLKGKKERKIDMSKPVHQPPATKKWEAAVEKAKLEREEKENFQREKEKQDQERLMKKNKIKDRVQNSNAIRDNRKALKDKKEVISNQIQEKMNNDKNRFALWKKEMGERISQRPLLVETATKRDKAFEKMKQLSRLHKIMIETGIKNKDIFTAEEKELLEDLEFLKKHNMLKDII